MRCESSVGGVVRVELCLYIIGIVMSKQYTPEEVGQHNRQDDCWISVHGRVYNITTFLDDHPGGKKVLLREAGKVHQQYSFFFHCIFITSIPQDASKQFDLFHKPDVLQRFGAPLLVGELSAAGSPQPSTPTAQTKEERHHDGESPRNQNTLAILNPKEAAFGTH